MRSQTLLFLFVGVLGLAVISGCAPKPELSAVKLPDMGTDPVAFCRFDENKKLIVTVTNQGGGDAPASSTRVTFTSVPTGDFAVDLPTPAIASGASRDLDPIDLATLPSNCYQPDCYFTITIDSANAVDEANEENNSAEGYCLG